MLQRYENMKLLIIDNYDSFTYNLVQMVEEAGCTNYSVELHDKIDIEHVAKFDKILISPGPSLPEDYPILHKVIQLYGEQKSILGICLGMQAINTSFGGLLYNLDEVIHGQEHLINILVRDPIFNKLPAQFPVGLYHSWAISNMELPDCLEITSRSQSGVVMSIRHKQYDIKGLQFHPESIITKNGFQIIRNWIDA